MLDKILARDTTSADYLADLASFAKAASREKLIRGAGLFLIIIAMVLQMFTAVIPNKVAASPSQNDLIPGGVSSKVELVKDCNNNTNHINKILDYYGIDCQDLAKGDVVDINSRDYNDRLYSAGHIAYGFASETPVNIKDETIYWRLLHAWDTNGSSIYKALKFTSSTGQIFWVLFTCGNLVHVNVPKQPPPPSKPCPYNPALNASNPKCKPPKPCPYDQNLPVSSPDCKPPTPCPYNKNILATEPSCKPCAGSTNQVDALACLDYHKSAANLTLSINNANNSTAKAGNVIKYSLSVTNSGKLIAKNFVIKDSISDILDYATVTDFGGGTLDDSGFISYPAVNIKPNETVTKTFNVTVKTPVPTTAPPLNDPQKFNSVMTNVFGDTINIKVEQPPAQTVVTIASSLPNTGPGASMFVYVAIAMVAGYFYNFRRLQLKEAKIAAGLL